MQEIPRYRSNPMPVMVKCQGIRPSPGGPSWERWVEFHVAGEVFGGWVNENHVDEESNLLKAVITADLNDGAMLVEVPVEMLTSSRFVLKSEDVDEVLQF